MKVIKILAFTCCLLTFNSWANYSIEKIETHCGQGQTCIDMKEKFDNLKSVFNDEFHLQESLKMYLKDGGIKNFNYELIQQDNKSYKLSIDFEIKPIVKDIEFNISGKYDVSLNKKALTIKEGDYFDETQIDNSVRILNENLKERGFDQHSVTHNILREDDEINIIFNINVNSLKKIKKFVIETENQKLKNFVHQRLLLLVNRAPDILRIRTILKNIEQDLFQSGFYYIEVNLDHIANLGENFVVPTIKISKDEMYLFTIEGNKIFSRFEIISKVRESVRKNQKVLDRLNIEKIISQTYKKHSYLETIVTVKEKQYSDIHQKKINHFFISISELEKAKVKKILFSGNNIFSSKEIMKFFHEKGTDLATRFYVDEEYFENFSDILKNEYLTKGYVQVDVSRPLLTKIGKFYNVEYKINELDQTLIDKIAFNGVSTEIAISLKDILINKENKPFNPLVFSEDIKNIQSYLRDLGYYYVVIKNAEGNEMIKYNDDNSNVSFVFDIDLSEKIFLDKVIIIGNVKTKTTVINREIFLKKGDLITPENVDEIKNLLNGLGLFSTVKVLPLKETLRNSKVDLLVSVKEKNFGTIDVSPGYRTDLGPKISSGIVYSNLNGMNRTVSFRGQINKRENGSTLDPRRRAQGKSNFEYNLRTSFTEPYLFNKSLAYTGALSTFKRRYYSFDADIVRVNNTFTKDITKKFGLSLTQQYETINQWDASNIQDDGYYQIGAMIPSMTLDLRNNRTNPTEGAFFNLSLERANPIFLSQKNEKLTVDYYKLVSRNSFYVPLKEEGVVAISLALGKQENRTAGSYIPNIKVFRISGVDIVRGYDNAEINKLPDGRDISVSRVFNDAYFINLKFEPRYFINDETMIGIFYDAGRVYVDTFRPSELRSSTGISFKYLTPVGSINFDYGFKLDRRHYPDGSIESPGRFHVSIGFF